MAVSSGSEDRTVPWSFSAGSLLVLVIRSLWSDVGDEAVKAWVWLQTGWSTRRRERERDRRERGEREEREERERRGG